MSVQASSDASSTSGRMIGMIVSGVIAIGCLIASIVLTSLALGSESKWHEIKKEVVTKVWPLTLIGTLFLFITSALYILQDPKNTMYFLLVLCCLSLGIAYSALVISVMST